MRKTIIDSILAGICISLGGVAFLKVGGIVGAVLFSFGLITVVCYKMKLYTGVSGFVAFTLMFSGKEKKCSRKGKKAGKGDLRKLRSPFFLFVFGRKE